MTKYREVSLQIVVYLLFVLLASTMYLENLAWIKFGRASELPDDELNLFIAEKMYCERFEGLWGTIAERMFWGVKL